MTVNAKPIRGNYVIEGDLTSLLNGYQFTGTDRDADIVNGSGLGLFWSLKAIEDRYLYRTAHFVANNKVKIKRARLNTPGAVGLRSGVSAGIAASVIIDSSGGPLNDWNPIGDPSIVLRFSKFNEWENFDLTFLSEEAEGEGLDQIYFMINELRLWIDDYNIQSAYVGETFGLILEMEIDTAGMVIDYDGEIV